MLPAMSAQHVHSGLFVCGLLVIKRMAARHGAHLRYFGGLYDLYLY